MTKLKWNSVGERLFEAGVDRGVLYTKDVGAPPAPVAVGAPSATKPMLLPLRQWGVDQALWLPGAAGNYPSIPDTNVLSADAAHTRDSGSASDHGWGSTGASTRVVDPLHAFFGQTSIKATSSGSGSVGFFAGSTAVGPGGARPAVTPGTTYTASAYLYVEDDPGVQFKLSIEWRNSAGTLVGVASGAVENLIIDGWTHLSATGVPPATATYGVITIYSQSIPAAGKILWLSAVCFRTGSDPTFVPSTRIVGDIDIRWFGSIADMTPPSIPYALVSKWEAASKSYLLYLNTDGKLGFYFSPDGSTAFVRSSTVVTGVMDGEPQGFRATFDANNGASGHTVKFYLSDIGGSWSQLGADVITAPAQTVFPGSASIAVGQQASAWWLKACSFSFEIRDGIDGPIVASADFTNPAEVDGDSWTTPEGHTGTINTDSTGKAIATLVDRNCWAASGLERLVIAHTESINVDVGEQWTGLWKQKAGRSNVNTQAFYKSASTVNGPGFYINQGWGASMTFRLIGEDDVIVSTPAANLPWNLWDSCRWVIDDHDIFIEGTTTASGIFPDGLTISNAVDLSLGIDYMLVNTFVLFHRLLTDSEWAEYDAWDGSVANEPKWLRDDPDLVLYLNADADETVEAYEDNVVVSLHGLKPWYPDFHGIPWNGLVAVNERTVGGEVTPYYIDGIKYLNEASNEDFEATIEAFTYPEEFMQYEGIQEVHNGLFATLQGKRSFGLSYRTLVGNDLEGTDHAYKIHIIYNATVVPADRNRSSLGGSIDPTNFAWTIVTKPDDFTGYKQTAHFVIDSREIPTQLLKDLEDILYGTETTDPRLPSATELISMFETGSVEELYDIWDAGELGESVDATIDGGEL